MAKPTKPKTPDDTHNRFIAQMDRELMGWDDPVARLRAALDNDELELYCQPILSLARAGGYPMGEILVRLREEEQAMLPPGDFLPVFEHYEMMPELDRWVVRHTLSHLAAGAGPPRFSINVSGLTLHDEGFPAFVAAGLASSGVVGAALVFEIEETDMIERAEAVAVFARAMRDVGCSLLFDGFGRLSVSFAPLKALGFRFVKVDGAIIRQLTRSKVALSKMNAVVKVGNEIGVGVIAECIEDDDTLKLIRSIGAGFAQGFGIARPEPISRVAAQHGRKR